MYRCQDRPVECGVFDLESRQVKLSAPPADADGYVALAGKVAASERIRALLAT